MVVTCLGSHACCWKAAKEAAKARRHNFLGIEMRLGLVQQATETCSSLDYSVGEAGELRAHAAFLHATVNTSFLEAALAKYVSLWSTLPRTRGHFRL